MPVITFKYQDLKDLGIDMEKDELIDTLPMMSSDIEDFDDEEIKVEFFPNRPDNLSVEGVARSFKGFIGQEVGFPDYKVEESGEYVTVDEEVAAIRPYIGFAKIDNVDFSGDKLKYIMDFQENLHWVIGRDRKKVAIGIHNADVVNGPFKYIATPKDANAFVPLEKDSEMTPDEILTEHDKGKDYAHLIEDFDKYPLILDKDDNVLSMPPIINGELTKIKEDTHNIIVDVTGTDEKAVNQSLNIICSSFAEVGGQIKSMEVKYEDKTIVTPDLTPQEMNVHVDTANELIGGINLTAEDIKELLLKMRQTFSKARLAAKYPIEIRKPDEILKWSQINSSSLFFTLSYNGILPDEVIYELIKNDFAIGKKLEYDITNLCYNENHFFNYDLPQIFKQIIFSRSHYVKILLKYDVDFLIQKGWKEIIDLLNSFSCSLFDSGLSKDRLDLILKDDSLYGFVSNLPEKAILKNYNTDKIRARKAFSIIRDKNYELFKDFYECHQVSFKGGNFCNE